MFMTGSAAEVVPVRSVDHHVIGPRARSPSNFQQAYFKQSARGPAYEEWLDRV